MSLTLRAKLIISFIVVIAISGIVATFVGVRLIGDGVIRQAQDKVRVDLNTAREIYQENLRKIEDLVRLTATRFFIEQSLETGDVALMDVELEKIRNMEGLDVLTITDRHGVVVFRSRNPSMYGDDQSGNPIVESVLTQKQEITSTVIIPHDELLKEGSDLAERAYFKFIPTPKTKPRPEGEETSGMMMMAAAPVLDERDNLLGVIYGGVLLNRRYEIVDKIKETVYQGEIYKGKDMGTATIFQGDLRISTNVQREDGTRAVGTRVSEEVYDQVLVNGLPWIERAFVVNNWYITAYEPIKNIAGGIIGILYVGILEDKFSDMRKSTMWVFLGLTLGGVAIALIMSYYLAYRIVKPIRHLVYASERLAQGDLSYRVDLESKDAIGKLGETFNFMAESLKERDEKLKERAQKTIQESERLATVGQLAAGVAHELNNPLGGVLMYSHLLLEKMEGDDPNKDNLQKIVTQATRCKKIVKDLLDFSRQTEPTIEPANANELLNSAMSLVEHQAIFQNINITKDLVSDPPSIMVDAAQIQQVFINIALNAAEAMESQGDLTIQTKVSEDRQYMEIAFTDTGRGIAEEDIERLFEPFYTTKEVGRGTGLGLAISFGIIQRHNGTIAVKSKLNEGTTFTIRLPFEKEEK